MIFWNSATLACMQTIRTLQEDGVPVFFTIDAGPQVKAVCAPEVASQVHEALAETTGVEAVMISGLGEGAALESTA
jgi:diphosphomevalonate decarboxylase